MENLANLIKELGEVKTRLAALSKSESALKKEILEAMEKDGLSSEETDYGVVRLQYRKEKDYGPTIRQMEVELKEAKALAESMGDYTVLSSKASVVFNLPKDPF